MAISAPQPKNARSRRELILEAALRVIGSGGVDAVTHRRVAEEAAVALGSIAYYFGSRDELVRAAFRHLMEGVNQDAVTVDQGARTGSERSLLDALVALSERELAQPLLLQAEYEMIVYAARDRGLAEEVNAWQKTLDGRLAEILESLGIARPVEGARSIRGALRGFELERLIRPAAPGSELRRRLEVVLIGLQRERSPNRSKGRESSRAR